MLVAYVYSNKDEEYLDVLDTIEGDDNKEVDELFEDAWLYVWAFGKRLTVNIESDGNDTYLPSLCSENVDAPEYIGKILQLKNLLYAPDDDV